MSRCFPFPPPGYEKKRIVEHITLLAKEKDTEKKHKKDKDKKDGKQKDKERNKERHKEKDKDKVKDKKKEKKRSRHERSSEGDRSNVEKIGSNSPKSLCVQELEQRVSFLAGATGSQTLPKVYDGDQPKVLNSVSRSSGSYNTEVKSGHEQLANGQRDNSRSSSPKIAFVFRNGTEQRTVHTGKPMESNIKKSTEGKETQKYHFSNKNGENIKNPKRHKGEAEIRSTPQIFGYNGAQIDPFKEAAVVQEFERRIKDENGATGSQVGTKANALIQNTAQNFGKVPSSYVISFSQTKENPKIENGSHNMENGRRDGNQSKSPKVAIVHNFKVEERGREAVRAVDSSKKSLVEETERNVYSAKGVVDNRKKIQSKKEDRNKPREANVKGESGNNVVLSRFGQNGSDSAGSSKTFTLSMNKKNAEAITGKRKEPEANGTVITDNEIRPKKWQKTVVSTQPAVENGRHLKSGTTITFSASKQVPPNGITVNADNQRPNWTFDAQSLPVTKQYPPDSLKPMGTSPPGMAKPPISGKAYGKVHQGSLSPLGLTKPQSSIPVTTGSRNPPLVSAKPPLTTVIHEPPPIVIPKVHETVAFRESSKLASAPGKINGIHEIVSCQEPAKPLSTAVGVNGIHDSAKPPLTAGKVNGVLEAHISPAVTLKRPSASGKEKRKDKSSKPPPPHPDTKFLSHILSVPKMEELSELDEPEWLFKSKSVSSKESSAGHDRDQGEQVWAKAVQIESADVYALPYVIPY